MYRLYRTHLGKVLKSSTNESKTVKTATLQRSTQFLRAVELFDYFYF